MVNIFVSRLRVCLEFEHFVRPAESKNYVLIFQFDTFRHSSFYVTLVYFANSNLVETTNCET
jgi:hypothetical protein